MSLMTPTAKRVAIRTMFDQPVAVIRTEGDPARLAPSVTYALQGVAAAVEHAGFPVAGRHIRARWRVPQAADPNRWVTQWAIPVAPGMPPITAMHGWPVHRELWKYGTVAEAIHIGPYETLAETDTQLRRRIVDSGYEITGDHEEEYLPAADGPVPHTVIRYVVEPGAGE